MRGIVVIVIYLFLQAHLFGQNETNKLVFFPPFDSLSIEMHKDAINNNKLGYFILTQASFEDEEKYNLTSTNWYKSFQGTKHHTYSSVDSLLHGYSNKILQDGIPISNVLIGSQSDKTICELLEMIFNENGLYEEFHGIEISTIIFAALLKRGVKLKTGMMHGEIFFDKKSVRCD